MNMTFESLDRIKKEKEKEHQIVEKLYCDLGKFVLQNWDYEKNVIRDKNVFKEEIKKYQDRNLHKNFLKKRTEKIKIHEEKTDQNSLPEQDVDQE